MPAQNSQTAPTPPDLLIPALHARLPERIDTETEAGVCWVYAAPGAGKTCAIRAWAHGCSAPVHWHAVVPQDRDPVVCALALWRLFAGPRDPGLAAFQQRIERVGVRTAWELLLDELDARLDEETWIVIDGLDDIEDLASHPVWSTLLLREFRALRFVVTSCDPVPGSWSRWLVNRHIVCFGFEDLRWSLVEAKAWVKHWGFEALAQNEAFLQAGLEQSRGWGAGFEYLVRQAASDQNAPLVHGMQKLWSKLLSATQPVASTVTLWPIFQELGRLGEVPLRLVRELDPTGLVREQLSWLAGRGFLVQLRNEQCTSVYQFHPLFCELLVHVGQVPELGSADASQVASVLVGEGRILAGLTLLARAQCWDSFVKTLRAHALSMCEEPSLGLLAESLSRLPPGFLNGEQDAWLSVLLGLSLLDVDPPRALDQLKAALARPQALLWRAVALDALVRKAMILGRDPREIEAHIHAIDQLLELPEAAQLPDRWRLCLNLCAVMGALLVCPWHPSHGTCRDRALGFPSEAFGRPKVASLAATLVKKYVLTGSGDYARQLHRRLQWSDHAGAPTQTRIAILVSSFFISLLSGRFEELMPIADELDANPELQADVLWRSEIQILSAFAALCIGDKPRLAAALTKHKAQGGRHSPFFSLCEPLLDALVGASKSDYEQIIAGQLHCLSLAEPLGVRFYECVVRASLALNLLEVHREDQARAQLAAADALRELMNLPMANWCVALVKAYEKQSRGDLVACATILSEVFFEMREAGCYMLPLHFHRGFSDLLVFALENNIEPDFLVALIRRTKKYHHYVESSAWPAKFELCVMGGFSLKVDGVDKTARFRQAAHRFELLTVLMYLGGRAVSESELIACVWPYVRSDARARLRQAIRRLSQSLGRADAILWSQGQVSLNPKLWCFDLWTLSEEIQAYKKLGPSALAQPKAQGQRLAIASAIGREFIGPTQLPELLLNGERFDAAAWPDSPPALRARFL